MKVAQIVLKTNPYLGEKKSRLLEQIDRFCDVTLGRSFNLRMGPQVHVLIDRPLSQG